MSAASGAGKYFTVSYPPSTQPGALQLDATYTLWIPDGVKQLRAVIVHQHGCGFGANAAGETAAHDLHWQALAAKWDAALLAPRYTQTEQGREGCELWMRSAQRLGEDLSASARRVRGENPATRS